MIRNMVMDSYAWFVDLVAERRKLPRDQVLKLADGSIFTGRQALQNKLVDTLGGEDEILAYLETRKVKKDLPIVDWKPEDKTSFFFWPGAASWLLNRLGYDDFIKGESLQKIMSDKLFLDGLLSVWQGAGN
jgi:protease-4